MYQQRQGINAKYEEKLKMRLDHIAYRVNDRYETAEFLHNTIGYKTYKEFQLEFEDGSKTDCIALVPPEARSKHTLNWIIPYSFMPTDPMHGINEECIMHSPPEIFVSDGPSGSVVNEWVKQRNDIGGIHHIAYEVHNVVAVMRDWRQNNYAKFLSHTPLEYPGIRQVFTEPSPMTGMIYELIERTRNVDPHDVSVNELTISTKELC